MACSRMPKCSVRPYQLPGNIVVWRSGGRNDGSPFIVVSLLPARSAEPPHSSGSTGASAFSTCPEAFRVASPLASAGKLGQAPAQPSGSRRAASRSSSAARSGLAAAQAAKRRVPLGVRPLAPVGHLAGVRHGSSSAGKLTAGSKPRIRLVLATSSAPSAAPCAAPVFCASGAGQAMMVRSDDERRLRGLGLGIQVAPRTGPGRPRGSRPAAASPPAARASRTPRTGRRHPRTWRSWCRPRSRCGCRRRAR